MNVKISFLAYLCFFASFCFFFSQHAADSEAPPTDHADQYEIDNLQQIENKESKSPIGDGLQEKLQPDKECNKKKKKMNKKRGAELPRRTSKRLAGISIELPLELVKPCNQVHQAAATCTGDGEAKCADNFRERENSDDHVNRVGTGNDCEKKQEVANTLSPGDAVFQEEDAKQEDLSLKDLWKDPCIEFAIKTLTGAMPIPEDNKVAKDPTFSVGLADGVPENQESPLGNIWADPCIEFAVKTLTGDVPIGGNNRDIQNVFHHQPHYSMNLAGEKGLLLPSFWPSNSDDDKQM